MGMLRNAAGAVEDWFNQEEDYEKAGYDNYGDYWWSIKPNKNEFDSTEEYEGAYSTWQSKKPLSGSWLGGY
jgi:hypothetical protein